MSNLSEQSKPSPSGPGSLCRVWRDLMATEGFRDRLRELYAEVTGENPWEET